MYRHSQKLRKFRKTYLAVLVLIVAAGAVGYFKFAHQEKKQPSLIPATVTTGISYKLYYPKSLPIGYSVDKNSFSNPEKGIVTFNLSQPSGPAIGVAEQGVPPDLNLNQQSNVPAGVRLPTTHFSTPLGQATIDQWGSKQVCYMVAGQTWIILNVTGLNDDQIRALARSFSSI